MDWHPIDLGNIIYKTFEAGILKIRRIYLPPTYFVFFYTSLLSLEQSVPVESIP